MLRRAIRLPIPYVCINYTGCGIVVIDGGLPTGLDSHTGNGTDSHFDVCALQQLAKLIDFLEGKAGLIDEFKGEFLLRRIKACTEINRCTDKLAIIQNDDSIFTVVRYIEMRQNRFIGGFRTIHHNGCHLMCIGIANEIGIGMLTDGKQAIHIIQGLIGFCLLSFFGKLVIGINSQCDSVYIFYLNFYVLQHRLHIINRSPILFYRSDLIVFGGSSRFHQYQCCGSIIRCGPNRCRSSRLRGGCFRRTACCGGFVDSRSRGGSRGFCNDRRLNLDFLIFIFRNDQIGIIRQNEIAGGIFHYELTGNRGFHCGNHQLDLRNAMQANISGRFCEDELIPIVA